MGRPPHDLRQRGQGMKLQDVSRLRRFPGVAARLPPGNPGEPWLNDGGEWFNHGDWWFHSGF